MWRQFWGKGVDFVVFSAVFKALPSWMPCERLEAQRGWDVHLFVRAGTADLGEHSRSSYQPRALLGIHTLLFLFMG